MKKLLLSFVALLFFFTLINAQTVLKDTKLDPATADSLLQTSWQNGDFISAMYYIDYFLDYNINAAPLYRNRSIAKVILNDFTGACQDMDKARELGFKKYNKFEKFFYKFYCSPDFKLKELKKHYYPDRKIYKDRGYRPIYTEADTLRGMLTPYRSSYDVTFYDLNLRLYPAKKSIEGHTTINFAVTEKTNRIQLDLFDNYTIDSITQNGAQLDFNRKYNSIFVDFTSALEPASNSSITVYYRGKPGKAVDPPWQGGFVWKRDKSLKRFISVACEHLGASSWWPVKDHLSDKPDSMSISIEVPEKYKVVANGSPVSEQKVDRKYKRFTWMVHYPMPSYDATFYCGNYIDVKDTLVYNQDTLQLDYYVLPKDKEPATKIFRQSKEVLKVYSDLYGPYPFPKDGFGLVESPYEGMEHQGAIAFGDEFKKRRDVYLNNEYDYIIVHEIAHEWWGNAVSFADMADAWISEAFATYSELLFMEYEYGYEQYQKEAIYHTQYIMNLWPMVGNADVNENTFASGDIYNKGALMLHNLRCIMNDDSSFMQLLRDFNQKYRYQSITTSAFTEMAQQYTHTNLTPFFNKFLYDTKLPVLKYNIQKENGTITLIYKWDEVDPGFTMPFPVVDGKNQPHIITGTTDIAHTRLNNVEMIRFINIMSEDVPVMKNGYTYFETRFDPDLKMQL